MTPDVVAVRQNLQPIVSHGAPVPGLSTDNFLKWRATLGNTVLVWRSGIGVTADGALLYASGPGLSVQTLANVLARAGAVRAMELDINPEWTTAIYYTQSSSSSATPHKLLASMQRGSNRYPGARRTGLLRHVHPTTLLVEPVTKSRRYPSARSARPSEMPASNPARPMSTYARPKRRHSSAVRALHRRISAAT